MEIIGMILSANTYLYRYCVGEEPPQEWSTDFKNPAYVSTQRGPKNKIGAFFFFQYQTAARGEAMFAVEHQRKMGNNPTYCFITTCKTTGDITLLDLCCKGNTIATLQKLYDVGIDVLTDSYSRHDGHKFSEIQKLYSDYCHDKTNPYMPGVIVYEEEQIKLYFRIGRYSCLGQYLTDYDNGVVFMDELTKLGYEGYIFDEEQSSPTICLFSSEKLSPPSHQIMNVESENLEPHENLSNLQ